MWYVRVQVTGHECGVVGRQQAVGRIGIQERKWYQKDKEASTSGVREDPRKKRVQETGLAYVSGVQMLVVPASIWA